MDVQLDHDTVWLSQKQMSELFERDTDTVGLHIRSIFSEGELEAKATIEDSSVVQNEGGRQVRQKIKGYNLDVIISVSYRVKSQRGTLEQQQLVNDAGKEVLQVITDYAWLLLYM